MSVKDPSGEQTLFTLSGMVYLSSEEGLVYAKEQQELLQTTDPTDLRRR